MEHCPVCKEPMPALSKVCPVCGYVATQTDNTGNLLEQLVEKMESCLHKLKQQDKPTVFTGIKKHLFIFYIILTIQLFVLATVSMSIMAWSAVSLFLFLSIFSIIKKFRNKKNEASSQFNLITADYETYRRQANTHFGKNKEVKELSLTLDQEMDTIKKEWRKQAFRYNTLGFISINCILIVTGTVIFSLSKFIATADLPPEESSIITYLEQEEYDKAIAIYPDVEKNCIDEGENIRTQVIHHLSQKQQWEKASSFFLLHCMGKRGDYSCARIIIEDQLKNNRKEGAIDFLETCSSLHYPSDFNKLKKLIYK